MKAKSIELIRSKEDKDIKDLSNKYIVLHNYENGGQYYNITEVFSNYIDALLCVCKLLRSEKVYTFINSVSKVVEYFDEEFNLIVSI